MRLKPKRPPGRVDRKAAAYASDIAELRDAGYTYEAIREALLDVGVVVSASALRREVQRMRSSARPAALHASPGPPPASPTPPASPPAPSVPYRAHIAATGKAVAEAFFEANPRNPLFRNQEKS